MDGKFNPFAILNKQEHIISIWIYQLRYGALRFSPTQVSLLQFFSHTKKVSNYITDNQYFNLLSIWQIHYVHWGQYSTPQYFSLQISKTLRYHSCLKIFWQFSRSQRNKSSLKKNSIFHVAMLLLPVIFHRPTLFSTTSTVTVSSTLSSVIFMADLPN